MRLRPVVQLVFVASLALASCSGNEPTTLSPGAGPTTTSPGTVTTPPDEGVLYLQHAVTAEIAADGDVLRVTLNGVERRTQWITATGSGTASTQQVTEDWESLGFERSRPQAALVPSLAAEGGALLELGEPAWNEESRVLVYEAAIPSTPDPRLVGMVTGDRDDPPALLGAVTIVLHHPDAGAVPEPRDETTTTSTTTTTTTPDGTTTTSSTVPPTSGGPVTVPSTTTTVFVAPPPPPTTPQPPPEGDPRIVASTDAIQLPSAGGSTTFALRNVGSGLGSWSITAPTSADITVAPSSGLLFAGSSTSIQVTYGGAGPADDFATSLTVVTPTGRITIDILVAGS